MNRRSVIDVHDYVHTIKAWTDCEILDERDKKFIHVCLDFLCKEYKDKQRIETLCKSLHAIGYSVSLDTSFVTYDDFYRVESLMKRSKKLYELLYVT